MSFFRTAVALGVALFSFVPLVAFAADTDIVVTEIGAYEKSDHEWIEIFNKGSSSVNLSGWKFFEEATNHSLAAYRGDFVIEPGEYVVIADVAANTAADHPSFTGTLIDSSWNTLNESGETLAIKSAMGTIIEQFTYLKISSHSLERVDSSLADYTAVNWKEHATGNTIGSRNSVAPNQPAQNDQNQSDNQPIQQPIQQTSTSTATSAPAQDGPQPTSTPAMQPWQPTRGDILISEIVSDPTDNGKEWVEIYNTTGQSIDVTDWVIEDGSKSRTFLSGKLGVSGSQRFLVIENPQGTLNNEGDLVQLWTNDRILIDEVAYGSWDDGNLANNAPKTHDPYSIARVSEAANTYNASVDFRVTTSPTKGGSNIIASEEQTEQKKKGATNEKIVVSELVPNPVSHDSKDEYVELANTGTQEVSLEGWELVNSNGMKYVFSANGGQTTRILPGGFLVLNRAVSYLALKNSGGESIKLYAPDGERPAATLSYSEAASIGMAFALNGKGKGQWTEKQTPSSANVFISSNKAPIADVNFPKQGTVGESLVFDASDSSDPDTDSITISWEYGDGQKGEGGYQAHTYTKEGVYKVLCIISAGAHDVRKEGKVQITVSKKAAPMGAAETSTERKMPLSANASSFAGKIVINELFANPKGVDAGEYIEIKNLSSTESDLANWVITERGDTLYTFSAQVRLASEDFLLVSRKEMKRALPNGAGTILVMDGEGALVDEVSYTDATAGYVFARTSKGDWLWTEKATPLAENDVDYYYLDEENTNQEELQETADFSETQQVKSSTKTAGQRTQVKGVVSVAPGMLGKSLFYLNEPALQVYATSGTQLPPLSVGDKVLVDGVFAKRNGHDRVRVGKNDSVIVLSHEKIPEPRKTEISDMDEGHLGSFVRVAGVVEEIKWPHVILDDGNDTIEITVKRSTGIRKNDFSQGKEMAIAGIVEASSSGNLELLPRIKDDLSYEKTFPEKDGNKKEIISGHGNEIARGKTYVLIVVLFFAVLSAWFFIRHNRG